MQPSALQSLKYVSNSGRHVFISC